MNEEKQRLLSITRELYGRVAWSHKTHEKERELNTKKAKRDRWINVALIAITTTGVIASIPLGKPWITLVTALLAVVSTGFAIYQISFTPEIEAYQQRQAAKALWLERERLVLLIERIMASNTSVEQIRNELDMTVERLGQIYVASPDTSSKAFKEASQGLKVNEELTFSPEEIDSLLPDKLRQTIKVPPGA
jgi:hypothetical protein